jgi:hypothetical protein
VFFDGEAEIPCSIGEEGPTQVVVVGTGDIPGCFIAHISLIYTSTACSLTAIENLALDAIAPWKPMEEDCGLGLSIQRRFIQMLLDRIVHLTLEL